MGVFFQDGVFDAEVLILYGFTAIATKVPPTEILKALYRSVFTDFLLLPLDIISLETILLMLSDETVPRKLNIVRVLSPTIAI
jgi:hypothetical protein